MISNLKIRAMSDTIKIKPCNVGWEQMTPEEKGRHCSLCSKTVVDFTQMNKTEIQAELKNYFQKGESVCGHFAAKDVDEIVVEIPVQLLSQKMNFSKRFALALLVVMGTSIISCTNNKGEKEKLKEVVVTEKVRGIDTISTKNDSLKISQDSMQVELGEAVPLVDGEISIVPPIPIPPEPLTGVPIYENKITGGIVYEKIPIGKPENDSIPIKQNCELPEENDSVNNTIRQESFMLGKMNQITP